VKKQILVKIAVFFYFLPKYFSLLFFRDPDQCELLPKFLDALTGVAKVLIVTKPFLNNASMLLRKNKNKKVCLYVYISSVTW
jgi:hypothetical protein